MDILGMAILLAMVATAIPLVLGIRSMARGGAEDDAHSGEFMMMRVAFQAITIALLAFALFVKGF